MRLGRYNLGPTSPLNHVETLDSSSNYYILMTKYIASQVAPPTAWNTAVVTCTSRHISEARDNLPALQPHRGCHPPLQWLSSSQLRMAEYSTDNFVFPPPPPPFLHTVLKARYLSNSAFCNFKDWKFESRELAPSNAKQEGVWSNMYRARALCSARQSDSSK